MYQQLRDLESLRIFMGYHVFAVWDFMSLLKALQRHITCVEIPWRPSPYNPELVRLINEIVLAEESDIDPQGFATSHFSLYRQAMLEVGADISLIDRFIGDGDIAILPQDLQDVIGFHVSLAATGKLHEVAASFFFGREQLIPAMFESIVSIVSKNSLQCPQLLYYLKRHIELDGDEHGPKAEQCLAALLDTEEKEAEAVAVAVQSLQYRQKLWDFILTEQQRRRDETIPSHRDQGVQLPDRQLL